MQLSEMHFSDEASRKLGQMKGRANESEKLRVCASE